MMMMMLVLRQHIKLPNNDYSPGYRIKYRTVPSLISRVTGVMDVLLVLWSMESLQVHIISHTHTHTLSVISIITVPLTSVLSVVCDNVIVRRT